MCFLNFNDADRTELLLLIKTELGLMDGIAQQLAEVQNIIDYTAPTPHRGLLQKVAEAADMSTARQHIDTARERLHDFQRKINEHIGMTDKEFSDVLDELRDINQRLQDYSSKYRQVLQTAIESN